MDLDGGGIDRYLYNYCSRISSIDFDFAVVDSKKDGILEVEMQKLGYGIYKYPRMSSGLFKNYKVLKSIMLTHKYDAVHVHLGYKGFLALLCAKMAGIKTRIVHAHIAFVPESFIGKISRKILTWLTKSLATDLAACGVDAAKWVWGEHTYDEGKVSIHNNAIDTNKFKFDPHQRKVIRGELNIDDDTLVIGHVGRISEQKNQLRLIDIYNSIHKIKPNSCMLIIGRGEQQEELHQKIHFYGLESSVKLLGVRNDVPILLNAMDVFVFPSLYEGLPFTLLETQCNGLQSLSADTVTSLVKVTECLDFLSLEKSDIEWANKSVCLAERGHNPKAINDVIEAGYDIDIEAKKLAKYYSDRIVNIKK